LSGLFKTIGLVLFWISVAKSVSYLIRSWQVRVAVVGHSMEPTLLDGDWLLRDADAFRQRAPVVGELVVVNDPRQKDRLLIKRVARIESNDGLILAGDHPAHADDGETIGPVWAADLLGRPWFRYWPWRRLGRVR
jgi:phage repressor protein C with HTH and peptisase S24 domain